VAAFEGGAKLYLAAKIMAFRRVEMDLLFGTSLVAFRGQTLLVFGTDL
jgi:hypothetical protein